MTGTRPPAPRWARALVSAALVPVLIYSCGPQTGSAPSGREPTFPGERTARGATTETTTPRATAGDDVLEGTGGDDVIRGGGGDDRLRGGEGRDELYGGPGDDVVDAQDPGSAGPAGRDVIHCGPGRDEVLMDAEDEERPDGCEMAGVGAS